MRRFNRVAHDFYEPVRIVGGAKTRAIIQRPPDIDQPGVEFQAPSLICRVQRNSILSAGQVIETGGGEKYLLAKHSATADWTTFHMFYVDRLVTWERQVPTVDRLTGLKGTGSTKQDLGGLWVVWERMRREFTELALRVSQERHLVLAGAEVQIGDLIDGVVVDRVSDALGIRVLELRS